VLAAVAGEVAVVMVDHRDARAHEAGDREHRNAGAQSEGRVRVAPVVEVAQRIMPAARWAGFQWRRPKLRKSFRPPRAFGNRISFSERGRRSSASSAFACSGTAPLLSRVFVCLSLPLGVGTSHVDDASLEIDVAGLESEELRWPQSSRRGGANQSR
jgi:hypothetical protein